MQASTNSSTNSQLSNSIAQTNSDLFVTIPLLGNYQKSLQIMTEQQISYNIIQLNLISIYNQIILDRLYRMSTQTKFYLYNRYILQNVMNVNQQISPSIHSSKLKKNKHKKQVSQICGKYDSIYVNGNTSSMKKQQKFQKAMLFKEVRATFISQRQQFIGYLQELTSSLKEKENQYDQQQLRSYFQSKLDTLNKCQLHNSLSQKKLQMLKCSATSFQSNQDNLSQVSSVESSPQKQSQIQKQALFTMYFNNNVYSVKHIKIQSSSYIRTKNRFPLIIDFGFARFIYKQDNQLGHEIIAMHMLKYINKIISLRMKSQQIIQYEIIPQNKGAFYQFVENSKTIDKIKKQYKGGIKQYLDLLEKKTFHGQKNGSKHISSVRRRFAQTLAGFATAQYFLEIKDRNNANIMIKDDGSIFHIDLAFIFNATPGGLNFQTAPFKFPQDYLDAMGGFQSDTFVYFQSLLISNFTRLVINSDQLLTKISILSARKQEIPCFQKFSMKSYKNKLPVSIDKVRSKIEDIISESYDNWRTNKYDNYQFKTNGILP